MEYENDPVKFLGYDCISWAVGNARQTAAYFVTRWGFDIIAYKGPETGSQATVSYIVSNGDVTFVFTSPALGLPLNLTTKRDLSSDEREELRGVHKMLTRHGDGINDITFRVNEDIASVWEKAVSRGARSVTEPVRVQYDCGELDAAVIHAYGDTTHTFVNRQNYDGPFLPGYAHVDRPDPINVRFPKVDLIEIDHCVANQEWDGLNETLIFYEKCLDFRRCWAPDESSLSADPPTMRSVALTSHDGTVKMQLNEPAANITRSPAEGFVDHYNGSGIQHIAFRTNDIVTTVRNLLERGVEFVSVPNSYYEGVRQRLQDANFTLNEDIDTLQQLNILIAFDEGGYLLQIYAKHISDRPTVFLQVLQRNNFSGFGIDNFRILFEAYDS